jgi:hypothetical protein
LLIYIQGILEVASQVFNDLPDSFDPFANQGEGYTFQQFDAIADVEGKPKLRVCFVFYVETDHFNFTNSSPSYWRSQCLSLITCSSLQLPTTKVWRKLSFDSKEKVLSPILSFSALL